MEVTMQVVSKEILKPSSPTPPHLRKLKLSYIDQLHRSNYIPLIFFYAPNESTALTASRHSQISHHLKQSLSEALTSFYPLAGTVSEDGSLDDCNDTGVEMVEARVNGPLDVDSIKQHSVDELKQYLPFDPTDGKGTILTAVKLVFFDCGGISIGVCVSHKVADGGSVVAFIKAWAATCRGQTDFSPLDFYLGDYFPARENLPNHNGNFMVLSDENCRGKRFFFDEETLRVLKREAASPLVTNPSRVEAVSAFIWMHFIAMTKSKTTATTFPAMQAVCLRRRTKPPVSLENAFGNCYMLSLSLYNDQCSSISNMYQDLVSLLRNSVKKIDHDYIVKAQRGDNYLDDFPLFSSIQTKGVLSEACVFSSWCRFPVYEVDFGWGSPTWVGTTASPVRNTIIMSSTKSGKGIEALVNMEEDKIEMLELQIDLLYKNVGRDG